MRFPFLDVRLALRSVVLAGAVLSFQGLAQSEEPSQLRMPESLRIATTPSEYQAYDFLRDEEEGELSEGAIEIVRERYPDGNVKIERHVTLDADGNYVNHGVWRMLSPKGTVIAEGQYDMGKRIGTWSKWFERNDSRVLNKFPFNRFKAPFVSQANFVDGVMHGEWVIVDSSQRNCMQISLNMGERDGPAITWLPNGKTYHQMTYDDGKPVGDVLEPNSRSGELERTASYLDGRKIVTKTTYYRGRRK
jgi:antitoxin component YwqK of YwqJK toxin-antitoxin module